MIFFLFDRIVNKKNLFLVLALILIDWLDFSLYLYLAKPIITPTFFGTMQGGLLLSFLIFSASYLARPIGGFYFGRYADQNGRRGPLIHTAFLMGIATLCICLLPDYQHVGIFATLGLLLLRVAQGIALGGEVHTSAMFLIEHHREKKILTGCYVAMASALGMFLGALLAALAQLESLHLSWRFLFALVGGLSVGICYLRKSLIESPEFQYQSKIQRPLWPTFKHEMLTIFLVSFFVSCMVYICNVFWVSFAMSMTLMPAWLCAWTGSLAQLFSAILAYPIAKKITTETAPKCLNLSMVIIGLSAPFQFYFTANHNLFLAFLMLGFYVFANGLLCASLYTVMYQQLPVGYRCQWLSTLWSVGASVGALCLPLLQGLTEKGWGMAPGILMSIVGLSVGLFYHYQKQRIIWYREEDSNLHGVAPTST